MSWLTDNLNKISDRGYTPLYMTDPRKARLHGQLSSILENKPNLTPYRLFVKRRGVKASALALKEASFFDGVRLAVKLDRPHKRLINLRPQAYKLLAILTG